MSFSLKTYVVTIITLLLLSVAACGLSWRSGWYAHSDHINKLAADKKAKAEKAIAPVEQKAATANAGAKVVYKTIYRDVVKYVQSPNRTVCQFDDDAIRLRQSAIDAAANIPGFDDAAVQAK